MKTLTLSLLSLFSSLCLAAGDPAQQLNEQEAQAMFAQYKQILPAGCPGNQNAVYGSIIGGASPFFGSQTISLIFDGGATITVVSNWNQSPSKVGPNSSVDIKCTLLQKPTE